LVLLLYYIMDVLRQWHRYVKKIGWPIHARVGTTTHDYEFDCPSVIDNVVGAYVDHGLFTPPQQNTEPYCYLHIRELPGEVFQGIGATGANHALAKIRLGDANSHTYPPPDMFQQDLTIWKAPRRVAGSLHVTFQDFAGSPFLMDAHDFTLYFYIIDDAAEHRLNMESTFRHQAENEEGVRSMDKVVTGQRRALEMGGSFPEYAATGSTAYDTFAQSHGRAPPTLPQLIQQGRSVGATDYERKRPRGTGHV